MPLRVPQPAQPVQRFVGLRDGRSQQANQSFPHRLGGRRGHPRRVIVEAQQQALSRLGHQAQGIVGGIPRLDAADPQPRAGRREVFRIHRVVLEDQQGVEEVAAAGGPQDLGQPEVLVREQSRLALLEVGQERCQGVGGSRRTRSGRVLMNRPTIRSTPGRSAGRPETVMPKTTSSRPVIRASKTAQSPCTSVLRVRPRVRVKACRSAVRSAGSSIAQVPRDPAAGMAPGGVSRVGPSRSAR